MSYGDRSYGDSALNYSWRVTSYGYDAMSRRISVSNLAIQAIPLLQQAYTPDSLGGGFTPGYSLIEEMNPELSSSIGPGDILDY